MTDMSKCVLITGASSGIGRATARRFHDRGWNVVATMRDPERSDLIQDERMMRRRLDVTDEESIRATVTAAIERFGAIDVLVNNAGFGLFGPFEHASEHQVRQQVATNVLGLMAVTRTVLPNFRHRRSGVIVNVASMGGRLSFPFLSIYHATKWAVEGFTESLQYEVAPFGIRVKLVEPGAINTDFYGRSAVIAASDAYATMVDRILPRLIAAGRRGIEPEHVARVIELAATDASGRLRYLVGRDARILLALRRMLPDRCFAALIRLGLGISR